MIFKEVVDLATIFLKSLQVTFRRDPTNFRPRINKRGSQKGEEQKKSGNYCTSFTMMLTVDGI